MAYLKQAKTEMEIKSLTVANVKKAYNDLAKDYNRIIEQDLILCPCCGEFVTRENFYTDKRYAIGLFPQCKKCVLAEVEQRKNKNDKPNETKESVQRMLQKMDLPYIDSLYESLQTDVANEINEKNKKSPFLAYLPPIKSLPNWKGKTYKDSEFELGVITEEEETKINAKTIKNGKKRFGNDYSNQDLMFLENEYQDWITRYECNTKAQETIFERLAFKKWEINKATKAGQSTKDLDKTYQELLSSINILPRQNSNNGLSDSLTFGQLIEKWEADKPIPDPDPELADIDSIGAKLRVFFSGHLSRALNLDNGYAKEYDDYMKKYTVKKPEYNGVEENKDKNIYTHIFGSDEG